MDDILFALIYMQTAFISALSNAVYYIWDIVKNKIPGLKVSIKKIKKELV